jgi:Ca2+-binding RTX toxin-like protein
VKSVVSLTLGSQVENLILIGGANIDGSGNTIGNRIVGNAGNNQLSGESGDDTLVGGAGHDYLNGGVGNDSLIGGAGNDTYRVDTSRDVLVESLDGGVDVVQSTVSLTLSANLEQLQLVGSGAINGTGNSGNNTLTGNDQANALNGEGGNDYLVSEAGNDVLSGGVGVDTLVGGLGNDTYIIDASADELVELAGGGIDTIETSRSFTLSGNHVENLTLTGTAAINGQGDASANVMTGLECVKWSRW